MDKQNKAPEIAAHDNDVKIATTQNMHIILFLSEHHIILNLIAVVKNVVNYSNDRKLSAPPHGSRLAPTVRGGVVAQDLFFRSSSCNYHYNIFGCLLPSSCEVSKGLQSMIL